MGGRHRWTVLTMGFPPGSNGNSPTDVEEDELQDQWHAWQTTSRVVSQQQNWMPRYQQQYQSTRWMQQNSTITDSHAHETTRDHDLQYCWIGIICGGASRIDICIPPKFQEEMREIGEDVGRMQIPKTEEHGSGGFDSIT